MFRAQLILHDKVREVFESSLRLARESGCLKKRSMKVALDTTNILGGGAVTDTYNLLADGMVKLMRALAVVEKVPVRRWAGTHGVQRYVGSSVKGAAAIDWSDRRERRQLLGEIVADADRLLELARQALEKLPAGSPERLGIVGPAELLRQLLLQDIQRRSGDGDDGVSLSLKDGVSRDRMLSVHDPEMRHGHKSSSRRFEGHKAAIVVDTDSQLITAVDVLPGNAPDNLGVAGTGGGRAKPTPVCRWRSPWAMPPTATVAPARPLPRRDGRWWPGCRAGPTGSASPRMTLLSTWRRTVAPVPRDR